MNAGRDISARNNRYQGELRVAHSGVRVHHGMAGGIINC